MGAHPGSGTVLEDPFVLGPRRPAVDDCDAEPRNFGDARSLLDTLRECQDTRATSIWVFGSAPPRPSSASSFLMPPSTALMAEAAKADSASRMTIEPTSHKHRMHSALSASAEPFHPASVSAAGKDKAVNEHYSEAFKRPSPQSNDPKYSERYYRDENAEDSAALKFGAHAFHGPDPYGGSERLRTRSLNQLGNSAGRHQPVLQPLAEPFTPANPRPGHYTILPKRLKAYSDEPGFYQSSRYGAHGDANDSSPSSLRSRHPGYARALSHTTTDDPNSSFDFSSLQHSFPLRSEPVRPLAAPNFTNSHFHSRYHKRDNMLRQMDQDPFQSESNGDVSHSNAFDHYTPAPAIGPSSHATPQPQVNPYAQENTTMGSGTYYPGSSNYPQPVCKN